MPYEMRSEGGKYCVAKKGGETLKCYDDKGKAVAYLRALWANVHESVEGTSLSMHVTKATLREGKMVIKMTSSDTGKDLYDEAMSKELFDDFVAHINANEGIPEPFASVILENESWTGGMPYISLAHYKSGKDNANVPGTIISIGRDGDVLKATAVLHDTPLGKAVFKSLQKDLVEKRDDKIRVSIGFLDLEHSHGDKFTFRRKSLADKCTLCLKGVGDKIYKKGHLVHLALTRVPANPRTDVEVEKSMTTKLEDAKSIIEDEEVIKGLDLKSQAEDVLVIKSDDMDEDEMEKDGKKKKKGEMKEECSTTEPIAPVAPVVENSVVSSAVEQTPVTPVEQSFEALKSKIMTIKSQGLMGEKALAEIQSDFDRVGEVIKAEFTPAPSPAEVEKQNLETTLRSILGAVLDEKFQQFSTQTVAPMQAELETLKSELRAKSLTEVPLKKEETIQTVQRSLNPTLVQKSKEVAKSSIDTFQLIANRTMGLQ